MATRHLRTGGDRPAGGLRRTAPGATLSDVDAASRQIIADAGYAENFGHGLGHGVGLQIHEAPGISASSVGRLLAGSAVTVEPGVYLPDRGGVRIEDTLVVGSDSQQTPEPVAGDMRPQTYSPGSPRTWRSSEQENNRPWHRPPTSRTGSSFRLTASSGRSSNSSMSSPDLAFVRTKLETSCRARSSTRPTTPESRSRPPLSTVAMPPICIATARTSCSWTPRITSSTRCRSRWSAMPPSSCWRACRCRSRSTTRAR